MPVMHYGCEIWSLSSSDYHKLNVKCKICKYKICKMLLEKISVIGVKTFHVFLVER